MEKTRSTYFACHSGLFIYLSESIVSFMSYATTAHDAWNYLVRRFANRSLSKIIDLEGIFTSITSSTKPVSEYLRTFKGICDEPALIWSATS